LPVTCTGERSEFSRRPSGFCVWLTLSALAVCSVPAVRAAEPTSPGPTAPVESIVVTGKKLAVETLIDRKVYTVEADVQSTFGTVSDVLSAIPSVDVDADGNVSLRGDSNVLILIDGRPSTLFSGPSAGDNLQSIPATDIERIEVITTPPAQFKADGAAGVINIVTRKKRPEGLSGSLQGSLGTAGRSVVGANAGYSSGPLTASMTGTYRQDYRRRLVQSELVAPDPTTGQVVNNRSSTDGVIRRDVPPVGFSLRYALNERQMVSVEANRSSRAGLRTYTETNASRSTSSGITGASQRLTAGHDREIDADERLGFSEKLARPDEVLELSVHHSASHVNEYYAYRNDFFLPPAATSHDNLGFHEGFETSDFNADYTLPFSKTKTLKLGYAFEQDDYEYGARGSNVDPVTGAQVPNPNLTDDFKFRQQINSAYLSYQTSLGAWSWLAGLRGELTSTEGRQLTDNTSTDHRYLRAYPSLHLDRSLSDQSTLSFGASRRVKRPDTDNYNPYVDHEYTPNLSSGNSNLKPQFTQSYEVGYAHEGPGLAYAVTGYYRRNRDSITDVTENLGNGLSLTTKTNLPKNDSEGLEFTSSGHLAPKLAYSVSGNLFRSQIDATALGFSGLQTTSGINAKVKLDYRPTSADTAQITATRTDKRLTPQGYVNAITIVNLGYRHQLNSDLTAVVTVADIFNGQRFERIAVTPTFTQEYSRFVHGRIMYVGLAHAFGSSKKEKPTNFEYDE
jgi:outer membrane receptor for ferrienterochelin and colicin